MESFFFFLSSFISILILDYKQSKKLYFFTFLLCLDFFFLLCFSHEYFLGTSRLQRLHLQYVLWNMLQCVLGREGRSKYTQIVVSQKLSELLTQLQMHVISSPLIDRCPVVIWISMVANHLQDTAGIS